MPLFLLVFGTGLGQLGVLVQPQAPTIIDQLVYQNLPQSWTRVYSGHCWALGRVSAAVEPRVTEAEVCGAGMEPCGARSPLFQLPVTSQ